VSLADHFGTEMGSIAYGPHLCVSLAPFARQNNRDNFLADLKADLLGGNYFERPRNRENPLADLRASLLGGSYFEQPKKSGQSPCRLKNKFIGRQLF
jgi:hypothetical protein